MPKLRSPRPFRDFDKNVGGGVDRDKLDASDFAGPNRSYPIVEPKDVSDAVHSLGRAKGGEEAIPAIVAGILRIAKAKGPRFIARLPDAWKDAKGAPLTSAVIVKAMRASEPYGFAADDDDDDDDGNENLSGEAAEDDTDEAEADAGQSDDDDSDDDDEDAEDGDEATTASTRAQASGPSSAYHKKLVSLLKPHIHPSVMKQAVAKARGHAGGKAMKGAKKANEPQPFYGMVPGDYDGDGIPDYLDPADQPDDATDRLLTNRDYDDVDDDDKVAKAKVNFAPSKNATGRCGTCRFFQPDCNACKLVEGYVTENDWCDLFTPLTVVGSERPMLRLVSSRQTETGRSRGRVAFFSEVSADSLPEWIPVLPKPGTYQHPRFGTLNLTAERNAHFIDNFNRQVYQDHIPIDAEHETKLSGALAFYRDLRQTADGAVEARIEYTPRGQSLIQQGGYRYFSPELYEEWEDPATGQVHHDVLCGGAFTTRPFFKAPNLAPLPLVASELTYLGADTNAPSERTRSMSTAIAPDLQQYREALSAAEQKVQLMETQLDAMRREARAKRFSEIAGRFSGETAGHLALMEHIADTAGEESELFAAYLTQQRAYAEQLRVAGLFSERGSSAAGANDDPLAEATALARVKQADEPALSLDEARAKVFSERPDLYERYRAESFRDRIGR